MNGIMGEEKDMFSIVVVHDHHDNKRCHCLVQALRAVGYDVWYDRWNWLRAYIPFIAKAQRDLPEGEKYLLLVSNTAYASQEWNDEVEKLLAAKKTILPLLYEPLEAKGFLNLQQFLNVIGMNCGSISRRVITELELIEADHPAQPQLMPAGRAPGLKHERQTPFYSFLLLVILLFTFITGTGDSAASHAVDQQEATKASNANAIFVGSDTGYVYALRAQDGAPLWQHWIGGTLNPLNVVAVKGVVYVGTASQTVYALRAGDGSELWQHSFTKEVDYVTVVDNVVYVTTTDLYEMKTDAASDFVCALKADTGSLIWCHTVTGSIFNYSLVIDHGVIYAATFSSYLYALRASDGFELWRQSFTSVPVGMAIASGIVYLASDQVICAWMTQSGKLVWCYNEKSYVSAPVAVHAALYFVAQDGYTRAFTFQGKSLWQYKGQSGTGSDLIVADGVIAVIISNDEQNGYVYGLAQDRGSLLWQYQVSAGGTLPIESGGVLYVGTSDSIYAINLHTGALVWQHASVTNTITTGLLIRNGMIYFGSNDSYVYALSFNDRLLWSHRAGGTINSLAIV